MPPTERASLIPQGVVYVVQVLRRPPKNDTLTALFLRPTTLLSPGAGRVVRHSSSTPSIHKFVALWKVSPRAVVSSTFFFSLALSCLSRTPVVYVLVRIESSRLEKTGFVELVSDVRQGTTASTRVHQPTRRTNTHGYFLRPTSGYAVPLRSVGQAQTNASFKSKFTVP